MADDDFDFGDATPKKTEAKPRSLWKRFRDTMEQAAASNALGIGSIARLDLMLNEGMSSKDASRFIRGKKEGAERRLQADDADDATDGFWEDAGELGLSVAGSMIGGIDPTYVLAPGRTAVQKTLGQGFVNAGADAASQGINIATDVQDEFDPLSVGVNALAGIGFEGIGQGVKRGMEVRTGRKASGKSEFILPVQDARVTSNFGKRARPKAGASTDHGGVDLAVPVGTPVHASSEGVVKRTGRGDAKAGNWVEVDYGGGITSKYLHLSGFKVKPGDRVAPGSVFARTGKSGNVTGPHLHWSVYKDGKPIDPMSIKGIQGGEAPRGGEVAPMDPAELARIFNDPEAAGPKPWETAEGRAVLDEANDEAPVSFWNDVEGTENNQFRRASDEVAPDPNELDDLRAPKALDAKTLRDMSIALNRAYEAGQIDGQTYLKMSDDIERQQFGLHKEPEDNYRDWTSEDALTQPTGNLRSVDDPIGIRTPMDSSHEKFTGNPRDVAPANQNSDFDFDDLQGILNRFDGGEPQPRGPLDDELDRLEADYRAGKISDKEFDIALNRIGNKHVDNLTAAERQEMDASAPKPDVQGLDPRSQTVHPKAVNEQVDMFNNELRLNESVSRKARGLEDNVVWMSPDEYTKLALQRNNGVTPRDEPVDKLAAKLEKEGLQTTPWIEFDENGKVVGQEGLHRAAALKKLGYDKIPVRFEGQPARDTNPPAASSSAGTRGPRLVGQRTPTKSPEGHENTAAPDPEANNNRLMEALQRAKPAREETDKAISKARAKQFEKAAEAAARTSGESSYHAALKQMKGELTDPNYESIRGNFTKEEIDELFDRVNKHSTFNMGDKLTAFRGLKKLLGEEGSTVPTNAEIKALAEVFPEEVIGEILKLRPRSERIWRAVGEVINLPRALMSSVDLSAPLRQGVFLIGTKEWWTSFVPMFKALGGKEAFQQIMDEIATRPTYGLMQKANLALTNTGKFLVDREEAFYSTWAEKIPVYGKIVERSNYAYTAYLNRLRADSFDRLLREAQKTGAPIKNNSKALKDVARFLNAATGRGSLGQLNQAAPALAAVFFSPRLMASRIQLMTDARLYTTAHPIARKAALKALFSFSGLATTVLGLASMGGADVAVDPRDNDFGKIKIGNTRFDILGGFQQYIRTGAQVISGEKVQDGEVKELKGFQDPGDVLFKFLTNKFAPVASFIWDNIKRKDALGQDVEYPMLKGETADPTQDALAKRFVPMLTQDLVELYKEEGTKGLLYGIPAVFGVGVQSYDSSSKKEKEESFSSDEDFDFGSDEFDFGGTNDDFEFEG